MRKGFTLIELMVVVLIVAVLAAVIVPMMTSRIEDARWSEGKAGAGTIATALRAYVAERAEELATDETIPTTLAISSFMNPAELSGKYFNSGDYAVTGVDYDPSLNSEGDYQLQYTITVSPGSVKGGINWDKAGFTLDHTGNWDEVE
jgi:prepilin-type N-terminal cleavage/methylation domain-containing protein